MARQFISVCIFCFICATHSPCASHAAIGHETPHPQQEQNNPGKPPLIENLQINSREKIKLAKFPTDQPNDDLLNLLKVNSTDTMEKRDTKINESDLNSDRVPESDRDFVKKIFSKYGDGDSMTFEGFNRLITRLDILHLLAKKSDINETDKSSTNLNLKRGINGSSEKYEQCSDQEELRRIINSSTKNINETVFQEVCPILLYRIVTNSNCPEDNTFHVQDTPSFSTNSLIWMYSIFAVILISICGVLALVIIPVMQKKFYKPLIQFLVALAVGTLSGDALLHLLPHAMSTSHDHGSSHDGRHDENTWKGFVAMLGLTFFFIMERLILLTAKWRKKRQKHKQHTHVKVLSDEEDKNTKNDTQCMDRYNPSPYCYRDIMNDRNSTFLESDRTATTVLDLLGSNSDIQSIKKSRSPTIEKLEGNQNMSECPSDINPASYTEANKMLPHSDHEDYTVIVREHQNDHHGHSHKHGHVHAAPHNFSSVAWMVIMGDGLHNFTDGMAIGAAFSSGVASGFSTTVAVFCHELPHELGDFAMLLKAGMSIKQALFYNLLSSVLCIFGNIFGLWLGNTEYANSWVFAAAAGTFIYIALVDMIPELSSSHEDEDNLLQCILHLSGLLLGFGIMTLIALYEHNLKQLFNDPE